MMLVLAHSGHWLVQAVYVAPLLLIVGVVLFDKLRRRDRPQPARRRSAASPGPAEGLARPQAREEED